MRWQIAQYVFCDQKQTLTTGQDERQLEPMLVELLSYFCQNPDTIISNDQLIDNVWQGRIVTDNAISKSVTKLRKLFNDDARQPKFIATFPKKGYKFIANVAAELKPDVSPPPSASTSDSSESNDGSKTRLLLSAAIILVVSFSVIMWQVIDSTSSPAPVPTFTTQARLFTADMGNEGQPTFSPDGTRVSYMSIREDRIHLLVKNLSDGQTVEISHGDMGIGPASWSPDGTSIVYLAATLERCEYYIRSVRGMSFDNPQLLHTCPAGSFGKIEYTHDNNRLIYSENSGPNTPHSMYELNLTTGVKKRLNQPELYLGGNFMFDLHPTENKLLISSPNKEQWEDFYSLDLETDELKLLFQLEEYICCGIWSHDGEHIVLMGAHPSYELRSYDLNGNNKTTIHYSSRQLTMPRRHFNGTDYLYSSIEVNSDQHIFDMTEGVIEPIAEQSVAEMLSTFSPDQKHVAYISLESGSEEIWLYSLLNKNNRKLTSFNDGRHYIELIWSPDNKYLLGLTLNQIHLIDADSGRYRALELPQKEIRGVSFKNNNTIGFSVKEVERWRVYSYDINTNVISAEDVKWQFVQFQPSANDTIWLDQNNKLFYGLEFTEVTDRAIIPENLLYGRIWNLKKSGTSWYWYERGETNQIYAYDMASKVTMPVLTVGMSKFDISGSMIVFGTIKQTDSNMYQTIEVEP